MKHLILILIISLLLSGCYRELTDYTLNTVPVNESCEAVTSIPGETKPYLEYKTYPVDQPADHIQGNVYYNVNSPIVSYYDVDIRRRVVLCSQPNCTHNSEDCTAFLGGDYQTKYQVVGDIAYALINDYPDGGSVRFISLNLVTGERDVLLDLTPEGEKIVIDRLEFSIDKTTAFIGFCQYEHILGENNNYMEKDKASYAYALDLSTGGYELIFKSETPCNPILSVDGDYLVTQVSTEEFLLVYDEEEFNEILMTEEEYYKENPTGDYLTYIFELSPDGAYYSINRETGERTRVCGNHFEAHIQDLYGAFRERKMSFVEGDTVYIYDGRTGEITRCFAQERIALQMYKDGRIIYNIWQDNGGYEYFWYDLSTGETQQFQRGVDNMIFSLHEETADYFIGYYKGIHRFISKQDWYNENYDAAF